MNVNLNWKFVLKTASLAFTALAAALLLHVEAQGQACSAPNWSTGPVVWAVDDSIKVLQGNQQVSNQPIIPFYQECDTSGNNCQNVAGEFNPAGYALHPSSMTQLNSVWSCPGPLGAPAIAVAGAGRETVAFQLMITAGAGTGLNNVAVNIDPLSGPGATITSDNSQGSAITRYLEGYVPVSGELPPNTGNNWGSSVVYLYPNGNYPDPLIPFYDPYDTGNPAVATPFNVAAATTQGVWVDIAIPANQAAGTYTGNVNITGTGSGTVTIPISLTVWNGNLPRFNDPNDPGLLKTWIPLYGGDLASAEGFSCFASPSADDTLATCPGGAQAADIALTQKYQVMAHNFDFDTQIDGIGPTLTPTNGVSPPPSALTSIDWSNYDLLNGPALTPGGLFADGTNLRVIDAPFTAGGGFWNNGYYPDWNNWVYNNPDPPPTGLIPLFKDYATKISQHFTSNQTNASWATNTEIIAYTVDEPYDKTGGVPDLYQVTGQYAQALNQANASQSWVNPLRFFLTGPPGCIPGSTDDVDSGTECSEHEGLSYPALGGVANDWILDWVPNSQFYETGPSPNSSGYDFTMDGVAANSTAPVPVEKWAYAGGDPYAPGSNITTEELSDRSWFWIAAKYGFDQTASSPGVPTPVAPSPGGVFAWAANYWANGDTGVPSIVSDCSTSPFWQAPWGGNGVLFYPGNELGCYSQTNSVGTPLGAAILTQNPAPNTSCTTSGYTQCNGISGPIASMNMEAWRRGYEDYMYLYLMRKQGGAMAAEATDLIDSMGGGGLTSWNALNYEDVDPDYLITGVFTNNGGYGHGPDCTAPELNLPEGPTGAYWCPGEWSHNPYQYAQARISAAQMLGFASNTAPTVTSVSPASGPETGGTVVTIIGTNFTVASTVSFGTTPANITSLSPTQIVAVAPTVGPVMVSSTLTDVVGPVNVTVVNANSASLANSSDVFTYVLPANGSSPVPVVTGITPAGGSTAGGTSVTITGTNFDGATAVNFGSAPAASFVVSSGTQITAVAPAGAGMVDVTVLAPGGTSAITPADQFTYAMGSYTLSVNPSTLTIQAGSNGNADFTLTPTGGYTGSVMLSCQGMPAYATCSFGQNPVTMSGNNQPMAVVLTVDTNRMQAAAFTGTKNHSSSSMLPAVFLWPSGLMGLAAFVRRKRQGRKHNRQGWMQIGLLALVTCAMAGVLSSCAGTTQSTPAGTSTVTVMSTAQNGSNGLSQSATFTLTITQ